MGAVAFTAAASNKRGSRPSRLYKGGYECAEVCAVDFTPWWRDLIAELPDGEFPMPKKASAGRVKISIVTRGLIEPLGFHRDGKWQYRLTDYGTAVRDVIRKAWS